MSFTLRDLAVVVAVVLGILLLMIVVRYVGRRVGLGPEVQRKLVHVATGGASLTFPWLFSNPLPVIVLIAAAILVMLALRSGRLFGLGSVLHEVKRESWGEVYLALAIAITFYRSAGHPILFVLPMLVITLSDTASALVGTAYGRRRFAVEDGTKSIEGVVAFFAVTCLCAMITLLLLSGAGRLNVVLLSILIAAFCALIEADSWRGLDNLFVPIGAYMLLAQYLAAGPEQLLLTAGLFLVIMAVLLAFAPALRMTDRAARGYSVLLFLVISSVSPLNAILPGLAIACQMLARSTHPCTSERPDLDLLAVAIVVALFWLLVGDQVGHSVISLFNLTFAGAALAFLCLSLDGWWRLLVAPAGFVIGTLVIWVVQMNLPYSIWLEPAWWAVALALVVAVGVPPVRPGWFLDHRSIKVFIPALLIPIILCLKEMLT